MLDLCCKCRWALFASIQLVCLELLAGHLLKGFLNQIDPLFLHIPGDLLAKIIQAAQIKVAFA